jgi:hypothetical protein
MTCSLTAEMLFLMGLLACPPEAKHGETIVPKTVQTVPIAPPLPAVQPPPPPERPIDPASVPLLPPPEYDQPYTGELTVTTHETQADVLEACGYNPATWKWRPLACAKVSLSGERCHIHLPPDYLIIRQGKTREGVMRHEIGHCNGWRHGWGSPEKSAEAIAGADFKIADDQRRRLVVREQK